MFQKLAEAGLKLKPSKCEFFKEQIPYLGHVVSGEGVSTSPKKVEAVVNWPVPQTVYDVRSFLGFVGYYRRFIKDFSKVSRPVREVIMGLENQSKRTAKRHRIEWSVEAQAAFEDLKALCVSAPILAFPDFDKPFVLHTDSSTDGLGAVLYQKQDEQLRVIAYASRSVSKSEANYPAHKLEFLALKWAVCEKFHEYLYGGHFEVFTDNNPLTYVLTSARLDACGQRWVAKLASYNFTLKYRPGLSNADADSLSRIVWPKVMRDEGGLVEMDTHVVNAVLRGSRSKSSLVESMGCTPEVIPKEFEMESPSDTPDWRQSQLEDPNLKQVIQLMEGEKWFGRKIRKSDSAEFKSLLRMKRSLALQDGILYRKVKSDNSSSKSVVWQLLVPKVFRARALAGCHDEVGHQGNARTLSLLRERFFWPGMFEDVSQYISVCDRCTRRKKPPKVAPLQPILVTQPLELVHMDYLCLEPSKGNFENVLVITDHFTKYALAFASKTQTAQATAKILWENFIVHYGFPEQFLSDQGKNFESELIKELCKISGTKKIRTTPYHPMGNGQCERFNLTLCNMLGTLSEEQKADWKSFLGPMTHAYNCTKHATTTYSPYFLMFGRHPRLPIDIEFGLPKTNCRDNCSKTRYVQKLRKRLNYAYEKARKYSDVQAKKYKASYDKGSKGAQLKVNDLVLVKIVAHKARHKLQDRWESEEYIVVEQPIPGTPVYRVKPVSGGKTKTLHRNLLLPLGVKYVDDTHPEDSESSDSDSDSSSEEEEVVPSEGKDKLGGQVVDTPVVEEVVESLPEVKPDDSVSVHGGESIESKDEAPPLDIPLNSEYLVRMDDLSSVDSDSVVETIVGDPSNDSLQEVKIGRASCRERC